MIRKILFLLFVCLQARRMNAQSGQIPYLKRSLTDTSIHQLQVETANGNISVTGVSAGNARVEIYVYGTHGNDEMPKEEAHAKLNELYDLTISDSNNVFSVTAMPKDPNMKRRKMLNISVEVYAPLDMSTTLSTGSGNISLKNLSGGTQDIHTGEGNLDMDKLGGTLKGVTVSGNIIITNSKEDVELTSNSGNIEVGDCQGQMKLATGGGNVEMHHLEGDIRASTSSGNVEGDEIKGELTARASGGNVILHEMSCSLRTTCSGGNTDVSMTAMGKYLTINNTSGDVGLFLPAHRGVDLKVYAKKVQTNGLGNFKGETDNMHINGSSYGGGIPVQVDGGLGDVNLNFQ